METPSENRIAADDRRGDRRRSVRARVEVELQAQVLTGETENLSGAGVFFFSDAPLAVRVRVEQEDGTVERRGRLVRLERMNERTTGFAVEFDAD